MLIIFDLDDTLIDTSGCITPVKLEDALKCLIEAGLSVPSFSQAYELLKKLDATAESSRQSLAQFLEQVDGCPSLLDVGIKEIHENISPDIPINALEGAIEVLNDLKQEHELALVTVGIDSQQRSKLKKAGIDSGIFSKIVVCKERNKKPGYQQIVEQLGYAPHEVAVCGDRIPIDLTPAQELGYKTIHIRWGRGVHSQGAPADFVIEKLVELKEIITGRNQT